MRVFRLSFFSKTINIFFSLCFLLVVIVGLDMYSKTKESIALFGVFFFLFFSVLLPAFNQTYKYKLYDDHMQIIWFGMKIPIQNYYYNIKAINRFIPGMYFMDYHDQYSGKNMVFWLFTMERKYKFFKFLMDKNDQIKFDESIIKAMKKKGLI
ncbi:MAG: hypothetical protein A2015_08095 [Spirochaetes bacterium GWF1_31_7]|nr:MAG: hypothetical protein A2Y30_02185 [Spirochaetes bacterium GWE1_32_154]OHD47001.1 MAG: hypothetical protein A2015_08095 [Spirochaetes bacterium GWF1_31_7]OHD49780.1 MAG: hypothetical protein A2Y29_06295 [Spirochaetes bacterium GWE2_31_10]HBD95489.1 hypothetical protein [Spirochaetia bacterium]HBI36999.1 hypothetical protein [Spirochaetia bacterium]